MTFIVMLYRFDTTCSNPHNTDLFILMGVKISFFHNTATNTGVFHPLSESRK